MIVAVVAAVVAAESFTTLNGADVTVRVEGDSVFINDAQIIVTDVPASNGIIHAINAVLLPPMEPMLGNIVEVATADGRFNTLVAAVGAVASSLSAQRYAVPIQARSIQDRDDNVTRFLVIGKTRAKPLGEGRDKTSLVISLKDEPGALEKTLRPFGSRGINLSKIESRPTRKQAWAYLFFIDFIGHYDEPHVQEAIAELEEHCDFVKWLGSYPNDKRG